MKVTLRWAASLTLIGGLAVGCGETGTSSRTYRDPIVFDKTSLPVAYLGENYTETIAVRGGAGPYGVRLASGELPAGLKLAGGRLTGQPAKVGTYRFTLEASDANLSSKAQEFTLNVNEQPPLSFKLELPAAEIRGETRIPLTLTSPRSIRAGRVVWELPSGVRVTKVSAETGVGALFWKQNGRVLTVDLGFREAPRTGERAALISVRPSRPVLLDSRSLGFRALDGQGKELAAQLTPAEKVQAEQAAQARTEAAPQSGEGEARPPAAQAPASGPAEEAAPARPATAPAAPASEPDGASPRRAWPQRPSPAQVQP
ncbi:Ig domain-containing protein [Deinococcus lacus]|uniref:Ig domain-containing protein n=1 Tax=Deinococcus lacus TaxID=392561 RepID=A0ABW1YAZ9_9DEIO